MPVVFIEAPPGIRADAKKKMVQKVSSAIDEAYHIGGTLLFRAGKRGCGWASAIGKPENPGNPSKNRQLRRVPNEKAITKTQKTP